VFETARNNRELFFAPSNGSPLRLEEILMGGEVEPLTRPFK
jgi:hypothetical protein